MLEKLTFSRVVAVGVFKFIHLFHALEIAEIISEQADGNRENIYMPFALRRLQPEAMTAAPRAFQTIL